MVLNWVKNRITLHDAEQEEIDKVFDFLRSEDREVDFNNIIPMPEEIKETMEEGRMVDYAWAYYQAKEFGDYTEIDKCLRSSLWVESEGIKTRNKLLDYFLKQKADIYEYGKHLYNLEKKYGCHKWYEWSMKHWKVKWNACDARREGNVIVYETPCYGVAHLILMVSERFQQVVFDYEFAATNFGHNTARYTFKGGEIIVEYEPMDASIEARLLAKSILGWEPKELFYY